MNSLTLEKRKAIDRVLKMRCFSPVNESQIKLNVCIQKENDMFGIATRKSAYSL